MAKTATRPISYFGVKLSDNVIETPEGYLVFKNAVIARTGFQEYKAKEIPAEELEDAGVINANPDDIINLYRSPEEVFSKRTIASFEGKDVTDRHTSELLDIDNREEFQDQIGGHLQNVRPGTEPLETGDMPLLADVYVTSKYLISKYRAGIRELSCGYHYHVVKIGNQLEQVDICGNHVAFVESGRAGRDVRVNDSQPTTETMSMEQQNENAFGEGIKTLAEKSTGAQLAGFFRGLFSLSGSKAVATDSSEKKETEAEGKDAKGKDRERLHAALDKMLDGRDNAKEEQAAQDEADAEALKALFVTPSQEESNKAGVDEEMEENERGRSEQESVAEEERGAAADENREEEEEAEGEDEAVETNPSPEIPAGQRSGRDVPAATDAAYQAGLSAGIQLAKPFIARSSKQVKGAFDSAVKRAKGQGWQGQASYGRVARAAVTASDSARSQFDAEESRNKAIEDSYKQARENARNAGKR